VEGVGSGIRGRKHLDNDLPDQVNSCICALEQYVFYDGIILHKAHDHISLLYHTHQLSIVYSLVDNSDVPV